MNRHNIGGTSVYRYWMKSYRNNIYVVTRPIAVKVMGIMNRVLIVLQSMRLDVRRIVQMSYKIRLMVNIAIHGQKHWILRLTRHVHLRVQLIWKHRLVLLIFVRVKNVSAIRPSEKNIVYIVGGSTIEYVFCFVFKEPATDIEYTWMGWLVQKTHWSWNTRYMFDTINIIITVIIITIISNNLI